MSIEDIERITFSILVSLGGGAGIVAGFSSWLGKVWAERLMASERAKHDQELEHVRAQIRKTAFEGEVRFTRLHERRAEILSELYSKLVGFVYAAENFLSPRFAENSEEEETYYKEQAELSKFFEQRRIFFPEHFCEAIGSFITRVRELSNDRSTYQTITPDDPLSMKERRDSRVRTWKAMLEDVPGLKRELENEFRKILGDETPIAR